ncbi:MAG: F0F1 ATP synthase subunit delta [Verrucomicrobiota bacterium]|jgi:F-type H+-transporting ATPase subunit delta|nr:F0F1 ATP synthase subunit delta [Acidimicrobiales bacterium]MDP6250531.1 F0F1 ATP synthase subunit delta [Verrucomicrobiota bacterium]MDP7177222.1 F0F1 ATP synthase subunit delta [Verrucomicrobiota bacterium]MDP7293672.1 F0F1 ATP synthase subunit delta [Verrucomicrobiota bacterium]MDP7440538.1 F0F1 ATP synthase subunit delta [Verrucomicrobiota bacterium]|tara:strand:- start:982 stop:1374 length:393 start_codon:yes stop_codon:yes gene_type:complete
MKGTKQSRRFAKQLFKSCQVNGRLDADRTQKAVQLLIEQKPRGYFGILQHLQRLVKLEEASRTARVESAVALGQAQQQDVRDSLNRLKGADVTVEFAENPRLIGGMRVKIGDDVFDGSVKTRLTGLSESF